MYIFLNLDFLVKKKLIKEHNYYVILYSPKKMCKILLVG